MEKKRLDEMIGAGLREIASAVPSAAGMAQAWDEYASSAQEIRIGEFLKTLKREMGKAEARLKEAGNKVAASGEVPALIERTIEKVRRENDHRKRDLFARTLANCICEGPAISYDDKLGFLEILDTMSIEDVTILKMFAQYKKLSGAHLLGNTPWPKGLKPPRVSLNQSKMIACLSKFESKGLIGEGGPSTETVAWSADTSQSLSRWSRRSFELLPYGELFIRMMGVSE